MAHQYQQNFALPENFHEMLKGFTREVLREQPTDIYQYGFEYFTRLSKQYESTLDTSKPHYYSDKPAVGELPSLSSSGGMMMEAADKLKSLSRTSHHHHDDGDDDASDENVDVVDTDEEDGSVSDVEADGNDADSHSNHGNGLDFDVDEIGDHLKEALMQIDEQENGFLGIAQVKRVICQFNLISELQLLFLFTECAQLTDEALVEYIDFIDQALVVLKKIHEYPFLRRVSSEFTLLFYLLI